MGYWYVKIGDLDESSAETELGILRPLEVSSIQELLEKIEQLGKVRLFKETSVSELLRGNGLH